MPRIAPNKSTKTRQVEVEATKNLMRLVIVWGPGSFCIQYTVGSAGVAEGSAGVAEGSAGVAEGSAGVAEGEVARLQKAERSMVKAA